jgi:hypothetical protein
MPLQDHLECRQYRVFSKKLAWKPFPPLKRRAILIRPSGFGVFEAGILQYNQS